MRLKKGVPFLRYAHPMGTLVAPRSYLFFSRLSRLLVPSFNRLALTLTARLLHGSSSALPVLSHLQAFVHHHLHKPTHSTPKVRTHLLLYHSFHTRLHNIPVNRIILLLFQQHSRPLSIRPCRQWFHLHHNRTRISILADRSI